MAAYRWNHWSLISLSGDTDNCTYLAIRCRASLNSVSNLGSSWKWQAIFVCWSQSIGFVCGKIMDVTDMYIHACLCGFWWVGWETANRNLFTFGSSVNAVDAGHLLENWGFLALLLICLLYDLLDLLLHCSVTHCLTYLDCKPFRKKIIPSPEDPWYYLNL